VPTYRSGHARTPHRGTEKRKVGAFDPAPAHHDPPGILTGQRGCLLHSGFFAQGAGHCGSVARIVIGQYLGFAAILVAAVAAAFGATFLPESVIPYLGLLPLALGIKTAWQTWKNRDSAEDDSTQIGPGGPTILGVAAVTFANGGDNIGVYVPVFATAGVDGMSVYTVIFLLLVAVWCAAGRTSPPVRSSPRRSAGRDTSCCRSC
jgi:cadmium resistance protein CadD (predicted permease)